MKRFQYILLMVSFLFISSVSVFAANIKTPIQVTFSEEIESANTFNDNYKGGIAYNGEYYLYISGYHGEVYRSYNQIDWEKISRTNSEVVEVLWDGKQFVIATDEGIATSTDGMDWNHVKIPDINDTQYFSPYDMVYTGNVYVLAGSTAPIEGGWHFTDAVYYYSHDLKTFHRSQTKNLLKVVGGQYRTTEDLVWNGKTILGIGNGIAESKDGKVWDGSISDQMEIFSWGHGAIWDGSKYVDPKGKLSKDGITWTKSVKGIDGNVIGFNGREYIIAGDTANNVFTYYYSKDAKTWERRTVTFKDTIITAIYGTDNGFILGGNNILYVQTRPPFKATDEIVFNDSLQIHINKKPVGERGAFKLKDTTYMPLRLLIDNNVINFEKKDNQYLVTDIASGKTHAFEEKDIFRVNNRLHMPVNVFAEIFGYDLHIIDKGIYFTTIHNINFSDLEKGNTYLASGNLTYDTKEDVIIKGNLADYPEQLPMHYTDIKIIYGDLGEVSFPNGAILKNFAWRSMYKNGIECELDGLPPRDSNQIGDRDELLKMLYVKNNEIIDPDPGKIASFDYVVSSDEDINSIIQTADQWILFLIRSNTIILIDVPDFNQFTMRELPY